MIVTKEMYKDELQKYNFVGRVIAWLMSSRWGVGLLNFFMGMLKGRKLEGFQSEEVYIPSKSDKNHKSRVCIYRPENTTDKLPAFIYFHGGGYFLGTPEICFSFYIDLMKR
jgi:acetyl esterase/lipase